VRTIGQPSTVHRQSEEINLCGVCLPRTSLRITTLTTTTTTMALEQIEGVLRDVFPHVPGLHYAKDLLAGSQCYESLFVDVHLSKHHQLLTVHDPPKKSRR